MLTKHAPLLGPASVGQAQVVAYILSRPHGSYGDDAIRTEIAPAYAALCAGLGVDLVIAIAQMVYETGNLTSFWSAPPRRNPASLGVTGRCQAERPADVAGWAFEPTSGQWEQGLSFDSWADDAIPIHIGLLLAFALPPGTAGAARQQSINQALSRCGLPAQLCGTAPVLALLDRSVNPGGEGWGGCGSGYGARIAAIARQIVAMRS